MRVLDMSRSCNEPRKRILELGRKVIGSSRVEQNFFEFLGIAFSQLLQIAFDCPCDSIVCGVQGQRDTRLITGTLEDLVIFPQSVRLICTRRCSARPGHVPDVFEAKSDR
jgi:hypothetical protein